MKNRTRTIKQTGICLFMLFISIGHAQDINSSKTSLPETVFGEWQGNTGNGEYNGLLIHPDFIEFGYRPFLYQDIRKKANGIFVFEAMDRQENIQRYELEILAKDSIKLKRGDGNFRLFVKHKDPLGSKRVTMANVPNEIKKTWFTTDGENNLEFKLEPEQIVFRDKAYNIEEVVHFRPNETGEYRFIVKNGKDYRMFYFKNWDEHYLQVGFNGKAGDAYKAHKELPNVRIKNFAEYASSENGKKYLSAEKGASSVPEKVSKWIDNELAKVKAKPLKDFDSPQFFKRGTARIIGYLKGYDVSLGFTTGIIYLGNDITGEDFPVVVQIHPDGRFEADLSISAPLYTTQFVIENKVIPFYIESGQTLAITLDLFELLQMDIASLFENKFKNVDFKGPLATENQELIGFDFRGTDYNELRNKLKTLPPKAFKEEQLENLKQDLDALDAYKAHASVIKTEKSLDGKTQGKKTTILPKVYSVLKNKILLKNAYTLLNYVNDRKYEATRDTTNAVLKLPVPIDFYDFLKDMPLDAKSLLVSGEFGGFINQLEFAEPLNIHPKNNSTQPEKSILEYFEDEGIQISKDEKALYAERSWTSLEKAKQFYKENHENFIAFREKYKEELEVYSDKYLKPLKAAQAKPQQISMEKWRLRDSVLTQAMGLEKSLAYEIVKLRALKFDIERSKPEVARDYWKRLKKDISHPFLIEEGDRIVEELFPETGKTAYKLPPGKATDVFKGIVDPFKGKIVFVDFWSTWCGPCIAGIKRMKDTREKYKGNKDFVFIFITDHSSPIPQYKKFVEEQELEHVYRLSDDDYKYLRELFQFNGIPRYVAINKEGDVINDNFPMHNFEGELSGILKENK
ncbi:Thiol-disulfide isomerase or thioredoxin [Salegentibacter echinorum]|uniref:Thiol-disulfide isomerase or thioredoxin n=1 Tax=Salegentibacter echinorum TaxID=1073325 RepID=A0A1M5KT32_SALEC|nr:TlpA disulfide reductase family protein [Salegentibacter echinorum]SHG55886.1 Thiol-disulfide isomerase or thioredoxin [Salegentibacter echinorum]